ncbi:hypothetical protein GLOIN_2v1885686 [Rhizophagus irregularis DAOM 181602=DAOM 197198]|nr:hypothetical protein GLOIN_2v1885686 [Rhizophagus irregularis DAOM 181602=DAOM 197198]
MDAEHENSDSNIDYQVNIAQISLKLLINQVDWEDIMEIWHITYLIYRSNSTPHFVILLCDYGYICNCLMILNCELRWFKLEIYGNTFNDSENFSNLNAFMNVNGNLLHVQLPTILDVLREENSIDNINMKIQVLEELYDTDKSIDESDLRKILNPHVSISSNTFIQDNNVYGSSSLQGKGSKTCSNCNASNHNIRRCIASCKLCNK